jgi:formylglycine-generating enzyme required for sulfatase activity
MVLIDGPVTFRMGASPGDPERQEIEVYHHRVIPRRFALAAKEVTVEEFQRYSQAVRGAPHRYRKRLSPHPDGPQVNMTWFEAVAYCNWLSDREGLPHCYIPKNDGQFADGMRIDAEAVAQGGYRLPTEAEWEYACRAGTITSRYYGDTTRLLNCYEWYGENSGYRAQRCGLQLPNDLGFFDMLGNVYEWCSEHYRETRPAPEEIVQDVIPAETISPEDRLYRGQSFASAPPGLRAAVRTWSSPRLHRADLGIRPARTLP